jgi:hypothetical protein
MVSRPDTCSIVFLADQSDIPPEYGGVPRDMLKHGRGKYSNVILVPQPSSSPNDPLNVSLSAVGKYAQANES